MDRHRSVSGHQGAYEMREIVNAILYQGRTGRQWAYLPHDLPQKSATYYYFAAWRDDGTDQVIHELLRCQVRERARRLEDPTPVVLDTQRVHAAAGVPAATTGPEDLPEHPDYPRILAVFNEATGRLRAKDVCEALDHELLPKNVEGTRTKLKRLVKLGVLAEVDTGSFARKQ